MLIDSYGRRIEHLRISLTELCNFRCVYCVPGEGLCPSPSALYLTREEIERFVRLAGELGITRIRLTGGEPLLRQDILEIVRCLKGLPTVHDLSLTTNGSHLAPLAKPLKEAGLDRVNISLDSLNPWRFREVASSPFYWKVIESVFAALGEGLKVKINVVALRGLTREEIAAFAELAFLYPLEVRFLEFMPLCGTAWRPELVLPIKNVRSAVKENVELLEDDRPRLDQPAQTFRIRGGKGKVGFIASLTESFCDQCSRIRLSADGRILPCLFSGEEVSVGDLLRRHAPDEEILEAVREAVKRKPRGNRFRERPFGLGEDGDLEVARNPLIRHIGG
ncbi:MAG: GTP 3',8-cyclase MoaA [Candidatus Omnitrophica bacterium]|nr:GTP 3',8-cyclase MoaA [Candidatus Omnitrophota bacterium]